MRYDCLLPIAWSAPQNGGTRQMQTTVSELLHPRCINGVLYRLPLTGCIAVHMLINYIRESIPIHLLDQESKRTICIDHYRIRIESFRHLNTAILTY